jgi:hypothetical protein
MRIAIDGRIRLPRRCRVLLACALVGLAAWRPVLGQASDERRATSDSSRSAPGSRPPRGVLIVDIRNRQFRIPETVVDGLKIQPTLGIRYGVTDALAFALDAQTVDNSGPGPQGPFRARRTLGPGEGSGNFLQELTLEASWRVWRNDGYAGLWSADLLASASHARRSHRIGTATGDSIVSVGNRSETVPAFALPVSFARAGWSVAAGPLVALLPNDNAMYLERLPGRPDVSFGTAAGIRASGSANVGSPFSLWADAFAPLSGRNTIERSTGLPSRTVAYNAGIRYHRNAALDADLFVSNTLGNTGALSIVADREYRALGTAVSFAPLPGRLWPTPDSDADAEWVDRPAGASVIATPSAPPHRGVVSLGAGGTGSSASFAYGAVPDLTLGVHLDAVRGIEDESDLGAFGTLRLVRATPQRPYALFAFVAAARSNNVLVNLLRGSAGAFKELGLRKSGFNFGQENEAEGEIYLITLAMPVRRNIGERAVLWAAPVASYAQREGWLTRGALIGWQWSPLAPLALNADVGGTVGGEGNALADSARVHRAVWSAGFGWQPGWLSAIGDAQLLVEASNRVGDSPFHALRVRAHDRPTVSATIRFPRGPS